MEPSLHIVQRVQRGRLNHSQVTNGKRHATHWRWRSGCRPRIFLFTPLLVTQILGVVPFPDRLPNSRLPGGALKDIAPAYTYWHERPIWPRESNWARRTQSVVAAR